MYKQELYNGGVAGAVPMGAVPMPRDLVSGPLAEGMARVASNVGGMLLTGAAMEDAKNEFECKRALMSLEGDTRMDVERRLHLPDGHAEALFDRQGNLREVEVANLRAKVEKRLAGIGGNILDAAKRQEVQAYAGVTGARLLDGLGETWQKVQREKLEQSWRDAYDLAVAQGRVGEAEGLIDQGVGLGLFSGVRGKVMKLRLKGGSARGGAGVSVNVNGREYSGPSAALAVAAAKEGNLEVQGTRYKVQSTKDKVQGTKDKVQGTKDKVQGTKDKVQGTKDKVQSEVQGTKYKVQSEVQGTKYKVQSEGDLTLDEERMAAAGLVNDEGVPLTLQAGRLAEVEVAEPEQGVVLPMDGVSTLGVDGRVPVVGQEAGLAKHVTLNEGLQAGIGAADVAAVERGREFVADGQVVVPLTEEARQWTLLPEAEVQDFCRALDDSVCVRQVPNADGGVDIFCAAYAPEVVARVAARANAAGELTAADAGEMVTVIALDAMHADAGATVDSVCKMFDGAGVYEALGDGDADVGRVRAAALVRECKERMGTGTNKLGMAAIERLVDARVEEVYRASGRDVARLNPRMKKADGVYEAWDARKDDARWHELKHLYLGLRRVFNPGLKEGLSHEKMMDEFDENAQEFYNWYADGVGKEKNAEYKAALKDWYMAQVSMRLADAYMGGGRYADGAGGYAADVAVARDVLKQGVPEVLNADVLARQREEAENAAAGRAAVLRKEAGKRYEQLRGLKAQRDMSAAREAKAKRAAEEKAAREEEKRVKAEEKAAAAKEKRRLAMARAQRRQARWVWDGSQKVDGEVAECSVPETLWEAMVDELGYDGETVPYILVGGKKVQVTGLHAGDGVRLNTTAAMLVQQAKKRDKMRASGELDFSFKF